MPKNALHAALDLPRNDPSRPGKIAAALEKGVDPNAPDGQGQSPLSRALAYHEEAVFSALLTHGANPAAKSKAGETLLDEAWNAMWDHGGVKSFRDPKAFVRLLDTIVAAKPPSKHLDAAKDWLTKNGPKYLDQKAKAPATTTSSNTLIDALTASLKKTKFKSISADSVISKLRPLLGFELDAAGKKSKARSFLGGRPLAPKDFEWPEGDSGPLAFIGQIAFEEVKPHDPAGLLPSQGIAYFFAASDEDSVQNEEILPSKVVFVAEADELTELELPEFEDEEESVFEKRGLRFHPAAMTDLDLLRNADDDAAFIKVLKQHDADWDGFVGGDTLLFEKFELDPKKHRILLHVNARNLARVGDDSSIYSASCFDFVTALSALKKGKLDGTECWFDFFH